jgi:hypothetical protein
VGLSSFKTEQPVIEQTNRQYRLTAWKIQQGWSSFPAMPWRQEEDDSLIA